ncbi:hypothetical protein JIN85_18875 [Luteolibacter pohnpeiensis]|uniref:Uncharacterized protein n=1 Tax=Luteolibacter pohnpeiensis TaxID=454153 RepID=A0A934SE70_9BACT|nr:hypothetical protein [Luteolibacter pohnpeiensis]MBK1884487.1 hypothetical protein [Luteolibacter pohnpeiensis]
MEATEFLAQRLRVPLDPILRDEDEDGFPDLVEQFYGTMANDASSSPRALRIEEDFSSQSPGPLISGPWKAESSGKSVTWSGAGNFLADGIQFEKNGKSLASSGGSFRTIGEHSVGASFHPADLELPPAGVTYVSFVMRNPEEELAGCFAGLLFYQNDREELFVGKIGTENSYGSRFRQAEIHDGFGIPMDHEPHLFVIRIDRNRLVTDVFMDPTPGSDEKDAKYQFRYQRVPRADRIEVRSGCPGRTFQSDFDEIRVGLTWKSVVPVKLD